MGYGDYYDGDYYYDGSFGDYDYNYYCDCCFGDYDYNGDYYDYSYGDYDYSYYDYSYGDHPGSEEEEGERFKTSNDKDFVNFNENDYDYSYGDYDYNYDYSYGDYNYNYYCDCSYGDYDYSYGDYDNYNHYEIPALDEEQQAKKEDANFILNCKQLFLKAVQEEEASCKDFLSDNYDYCNIMSDLFRKRVLLILAEHLEDGHFDMSAQHPAIPPGQQSCYSYCFLGFDVILAIMYLKPY